ASASPREGGAAACATWPTAPRSWAATSAPATARAAAPSWSGASPWRSDRAGPPRSGRGLPARMGAAGTGTAPARGSPSRVLRAVQGGRDLLQAARRGGGVGEGEGEPRVAQQARGVHAADGPVETERRRRAK